MENQNSNQPFAEIVTLEAFCSSKGIKPSAIKLAKTSNGSVLLTALGTPVATIKSELKGNTLQETAANFKAVAALCFGIPKPGSVDQSGRPSLPCCMESKTQWEEIAIF